MITAKQLLLKQIPLAFDGRGDMSLLPVLKDITPAQAAWQPDPTLPTIEQIVRHIAWAKSRFCHEGFGVPMPLDDPAVDAAGDTPNLPYEFPCGAAWGQSSAPGITGAIMLLEKSQAVLMKCLGTCTDESLDGSIPTHQGKSAAHFFNIMIMHDIYHAGQIRTRRTMYQLKNPAPSSGK